jgi:hypothetical protein
MDLYGYEFVLSRILLGLIIPQEKAMDGSLRVLAVSFGLLALAAVFVAAHRRVVA